jgi:hypothetical protein
MSARLRSLILIPALAVASGAGAAERLAGPIAA